MNWKKSFLYIASRFAWISFGAFACLVIEGLAEGYIIAGVILSAFLAVSVDVARNDEEYTEEENDPGEE